MTRALDPAELERMAGVETSESLRMTPVDLTHLGAMVPDPPAFILEPLIPRRQTTLLGAHGGAGKSMLALTWAAHVASGARWGDLTPVSGRVLYLSMEDPGETVLFRLQRIIKRGCLDPALISQRLTLIDASEASPLATEVSNAGIRHLMTTAAFDELSRLAVDHDLIIIDNASDAYDGDENHRRQVRAFVKALNGLARANNAAILLLAHIDKAAARHGSNGNTYSGSTAWHNSVRSRVAIGTDAQGNPELVQEKLNLGAKLERPIPMAWVDGVLAPTEATAAPVTDHVDEAVMGALSAAIEAGETVPTSSTGPSTAWHKLSLYDELPDRLRTKAGKRVVDESLIRLHRAGLIDRERYFDRHRNEREMWALRQCASMRVNAGLTQIDARSPDLARQCDARGYKGDIDANRSESQTIDSTAVFSEPASMHKLTLTQIEAVDLQGIFGTRAELHERILTRELTARLGIDSPDSRQWADRAILALLNGERLIREKRRGGAVYRMGKAA